MCPVTVTRRKHLGRRQLAKVGSVGAHVPGDRIGSAAKHTHAGPGDDRLLAAQGGWKAGYVRRE